MYNRSTILCLTLVLLLVGCSDQPAPPQKHPGDDVMKDPMGYKPQLDDTGNISGGGLMHFDKKAFDKDVNSVANP
jgi:hypothetical protein